MQFVALELGMQSSKVVNVSRMLKLNENGELENLAFGDSPCLPGFPLPP